MAEEQGRLGWGLAISQPDCVSAKDLVLNYSLEWVESRIRRDADHHMGSTKMTRAIACPDICRLLNGWEWYNFWGLSPAYDERDNMDSLASDWHCQLGHAVIRDSEVAIVVCPF